MFDNRDVVVWYRSTDAVTEVDFRAWEDTLSDDERRRRDSFIFFRDRRDFAAAHALLRHALSQYEPIPERSWCFERHPFGKPSVVAEQAGTPPIRFSLSHTRGFVACAVGRGVDIGVDVEQRDPLIAESEIAERYFAPIEVEELRKCQRVDYSTRFAELWTLKESYVKASGAGLRLSLQSFAFRFVGDTGLHFTPCHEVGPASFWLSAIGTDVRLAVAHLNGSAGYPSRISFLNADGTNATRVATLLRRT